MKLLLIFILGLLYSIPNYSQYWRGDGEADIIADSIEFSILKQKGEKIRVIDKTNEFKTKFVITWVNDSILQSIPKSRKVTYHTPNGNNCTEFLILRDNSLCLYDKSKMEIENCPNHEKGISESYLYENETTFRRDKKGRIKKITLLIEDELRTIIIKY